MSSRVIHDLTLAAWVPWISNSLVRRPPVTPLFTEASRRRLQSHSSLCALPHRHHYHQPHGASPLPAVDDSTVATKFVEPLGGGAAATEGSAPLALGAVDTVLHAPAAWFALEDSTVDTHAADSSAATTARFASMLLESISSTNQHQSQTFASSANEDGINNSDPEFGGNDTVRLWLHCTSPREAVAAAKNIASLLQKHKSSSSFRYKKNRRSASQSVGLCLPFPSTKTSALVLFQRSCEDVRREIDKVREEVLLLLSSQEAQQNGQETIEADEAIAIPCSVWMLSALSCPFGGGSGMDPVETADNVVSFLSNDVDDENGVLGNNSGFPHSLPACPCSRVFLDDTSASVYARQLENSMKTIGAVNAGRVDPDRITCAFRSSSGSGSGSGSFSTKTSSASYHLGQKHAHSERIHSCLRKLNTLSMSSVCGWSLETDLEEEVSPSSEKETKGSAGEKDQKHNTHDKSDVAVVAASINRDDWPSTSQISGWFWDMDQHSFGRGVQESSVSAQARLEELEEMQFARYKEIREAVDFASEVFWRRG